MGKFPEVIVINSVSGYCIGVAVYRHSSTPEKICVHIAHIYPMPSVVPEGTPDPVAKLLRPGERSEFTTETPYPM